MLWVGRISLSNCYLAGLEGPRALEPGQFAGEGSHGYTVGMKTAVSLPDEVFRAAERHGRRTRKSRSQLYAEAIAEYLSRHAPDEITEAMNQVVAQLATPTDAFVAAASRRVLAHTEW